MVIPLLWARLHQFRLNRLKNPYPRVAQSNVATLATSHAQSSQLKLDPSRSSGKSSPLAAAPPTSQRRRQSTPPHMVVRRISVRDARVFVSHLTSLTQDVMRPASQHAQPSYPISPSAPSKGSITTALAPLAIQHSQQQKVSQLTGYLTKTRTVRILVPGGFSFDGNVATDANH
jgi:hypothetical protein